MATACRNGKGDGELCGGVGRGRSAWISTAVEVVSDGIRSGSADNGDGISYIGD